MSLEILPVSDLKSFDLTEHNITKWDERTFVVNRWGWSYEKAHAFQRRCLALLDEHPRWRILITCNHPRVLTNGRGLQRQRKGEVLNLVDFDPSQFASLPYPLHHVERGGGLTFHHPGQFIFYPIVKLNPHALSLSKMIHDMFEVSATVLTKWGVSDLSHEEKLMGLWHGKQKIASMGIAIEKLTTFHGMALNVFKDLEMTQALRILNPCGLSAETYTSVEELIDLKTQDVSSFEEEFLKGITHAWQ